MKENDSLIEIKSLSVDFKLHAQGIIRAVDGISFVVPNGSCVALVGESGSGKSVTAQAILGILPNVATVASGEILFRDPLAGSKVMDLAKLDPRSKSYRSIRGGRISMIFQEPMTSLSPLHTVGNQVSEAVRLHRDCSMSESLELSAEMLSRVGFPDPRGALNIYPFELSGGLRQRAMIAMALVCRPALLIADEPTTALDVTIQAQILQLMNELRAELNMSLLLITHDLGVVANMADEVVVAYHGKVVESGPVSEIFNDPQHPYLVALMRAVPQVGLDSSQRLTPIREVPHQNLDTHIKKEPWPESAEQLGPLLRVSNIVKTFATRSSGMFKSSEGVKIRAVEDVSLYIQRGECLGLVGESGCGKTTLSKIIMRALNPDSGQITYNDRGKLVSLLDLSGEELIDFRKKIQFIFQDPFSSLNPRMTVFDIISEPLVIHNIGDRKGREGIVKDLMGQVGLDPRFLSRYPHSFSGGQRQRVGIARALALNPELIICDEPVSALDVSVQAQILNLLKDLQRDLSLTYLFISHNLAVVDYMADRIAVMCGGFLVEMAPRDLLFKNPVHPYTQALLSAVPRADPEQRLDLRALMEGRVSNPEAWPASFAVSDDDKPVFVEIEPGHFVRARESFVMEDFNG